MTFSTLRGLADCSPSGVDEYGDACAYFPTSDPNATKVARGYLNSGGAETFQQYLGVPNAPGGSYPTGSPSTGFNWGSFFTGLAPTLANDATKLGQQAIASPGTVIGPGGQVITGGGMQSGVSSNAAQSITAMMPVILLGVGGLLLIMVMKNK